MKNFIVRSNLININNYYDINYNIVASVYQSCDRKNITINYSSNYYGITDGIEAKFKENNLRYTKLFNLHKKISNEILRIYDIVGKMISCSSVIDNPTFPAGLEHEDTSIIGIGSDSDLPGGFCYLLYHEKDSDFVKIIRILVGNDNKTFTWGIDKIPVKSLIYKTFALPVTYDINKFDKNIVSSVENLNKLIMCSKIIVRFKL